jgi:hypothetical protein
VIADVDQIIEDTKRLLEERLKSLAPGWDWSGKDGYPLLLQMTTWSPTDGPPEMGLRGPAWTYDDEKARSLIEMAKVGGEDADSALCQLAVDFIQGSCPMPSNLGRYISARLRSSTGARARPKRRGPKTYTNFRRNFAIVCAVARLVSQGFCVTRNRATTRESACSIVAAALERLGIHLSEDAVVKAYTEYENLVMSLEPIRSEYATAKARALE